MNGSTNALTGRTILTEGTREKSREVWMGVQGGSLNSRSAKTVAINALGEIFYSLFDYLYELPI